MSEDTPTRRENRFWLGLCAGTVIGAGLAMWLVPRAAAELRERAADSAGKLGTRASERYQQVSTQVGQAVEDMAKQGRAVRNDVADSVVRGAHEVARQAAAVTRSR
jgi:gas vesicle protein